MTPFRSLCVFCGSSSGEDPAYAEAARTMGGLLAQRGCRLVYGGGKVGLMGAIADAVLEGGGEVVGVIPGALVDRELAHHGVTDLRIVHSMHERKALMADLSDGFIAMPGGFGTLEELFEVLTWAQLGFHEKPCGLLNVAGFFDSLLAMLDQATARQFMRPEHRSILVTRNQPEELLTALADFQSPHVEKWIDERSET